MNAAVVEAAPLTRADRLAGCLVLCPTPIGNLADITLRALEELRGADLILAEDTRHTAGLLRHHGIRRPILSYHDHNEQARLPDALARLRAGERLVLVSDAGTPGLADPGFRLVRAVVDAGIDVTALPGPNALLPALTLSGLPVHGFAFLGFMPRAESERAGAIRRALGLPLTVIWFESPHRLASTLCAMRDLGYGDRSAAIARELSKRYEEVIRDTVGALAQRFSEIAPAGEVVLLVGPGPESSTMDLEAALQAVRRRQEAGDSMSSAVATVAGQYGVRRRVLYAAALGRGGGGGPEAEPPHGAAPD